MADTPGQSTGTSGAATDPLCRRKGAWIKARSEAQPFPWGELGKRQRHVICLIQRWMEDFIESDVYPLPPEGPFTWQAADLQRRSNILLIHGGRGSGKTSVMLTLLELWRRPLQKELGRALSPERVPPGFDPVAEERQQLLAQATRKAEDELTQLEQLVEGQHTKWLIIPLKPLDLQPLPSPTSLLAWIASRIREFAELLDQPPPGAAYRRPPRPIAGWHPDTEHEASWRRHWKELADAIALGWEINPQQRQGSLDPESFTEEMIESERSRHDVLVKWRRFVAAVVDHAIRRSLGSGSQQARLVLPIDDVDMNPHRCVDLLDLLRYLWHPQLVFLLTGQSRLFTKMLRLRYHGAMRSGLGSGSINKSEFESLDARPSPHELAVQAFDRIIPPGQRFRLEPMEFSERLEFLRKWIDKAFEALLKQEASMAGPSTSGTRDRSVLDRFLGRFATTPFLLFGLPPYFRRLRNIEQLLLRAHMEARTESEMVHLIWKETVDDKPFTRASDRGIQRTVRLQTVPQSVDTLLRPHVETLSPGQQRFFNKLHITVGRTDLPGAAIVPCAFPVRTFPVPLGNDEVRIELGAPCGFTWHTGQKPSRPQSEYLTALLLLALDVAVEEGGLLEGAFQMNGLLAPFVRVTVPVWLESGTRLQVPFSWPTPDWVGTTEAVRFGHAWTTQLSSPNAGRPGPWDLPTLATDFMTSVRFGSFQARGELRQHAFQQWHSLSQLLLAAPESGLSPEEANALLANIGREKPFELKPSTSSPSNDEEVCRVLLEPRALALHRLRLERARLALALLPPEERALLPKKVTPRWLLAYIEHQFNGTEYHLVTALGHENLPSNSGFATHLPSIH